MIDCFNILKIPQFPWSFLQRYNCKGLKYIIRSQGYYHSHIIFLSFQTTTKYCQHFLSAVITKNKQPPKLGSCPVSKVSILLYSTWLALYNCSSQFYIELVNLPFARISLRALIRTQCFQIIIWTVRKFITAILYSPREPGSSMQSGFLSQENPFEITISLWQLQLCSRVKFSFTLHCQLIDF